MTDTIESAEYGAGNIKVLEGMEAVRLRPGMYIGGTDAGGLHHLVWEIVDNAIDEALAGHCTRVDVELHSDGSVTVEDNGRGIPTDIHSTEGVSSVEVVFTKLHAGGKFDNDSYKMAGGLHGVGASVVNALSEWLKAEVFRNGKYFMAEFARGAIVHPLTVLGQTAKRGTRVTFKPDPEIFPETTFSYEIMTARLRELAFLNRGIRIPVKEESYGHVHDFK